MNLNHRLVVAVLALGALAAAPPPVERPPQRPTPLTDAEQAERGRDIVRYCAHQIVGLNAVSNPTRAAQELRVLLSAASETPKLEERLASILADTRSPYGQTPWTRAREGLAACIYGRAMHLDAAWLEQSGWITFQNRGPNASLLTGMFTSTCYAPKGQACTIALPPGTYTLTVLVSGKSDRVIGRHTVDPGVQKVVVGR